MPTRPTVADADLENELAANQLWGEGGLDWFLKHSGDVINDQQHDQLILPLT